MRGSWNWVLVYCCEFTICLLYICICGYVDVCLDVCMHVWMLLREFEGNEVELKTKWLRQVSAHAVDLHNLCISSYSVVGLLQFLGMFLFASVVSDEMKSALGDSQVQPGYSYDWGSIQAVIAFAATNLAAILAAYSYRGRHQFDQKQKKTTSSLPEASMDLAKAYENP